MEMTTQRGIHLAKELMAHSKIRRKNFKDGFLIEIELERPKNLTRNAQKLVKQPSDCGKIYERPKQGQKPAIIDFL